MSRFHHFLIIFPVKLGSRFTCKLIIRKILEALLYILEFITEYGSGTQLNPGCVYYVPISFCNQFNYIEVKEYINKSKKYKITCDRMCEKNLHLYTICSQSQILF